MPVGGAMPVGTNGSAQAWHVHKFGGTSVGDATCFRRVRDIIGDCTQGQHVQPAVVVSAMGGKPKTTDMLIHMTQHAAGDDWAKVDEVLEAIRKKHNACLNDLFGEGSEVCKRLTGIVEKDLQDILSLLRAVTVMREAPQSIVGIVSGYGEQWSAQFLESLLNQEAEAGKWAYVDARRVLVVDAGGTSDVAIQWDESATRLSKLLKELEGKCLVITGFIASNRSGGSTTLGRDGSDFSASVFGRLLGAKSISIWTDVSGVLSADPRKVPDAYALKEVSYKEAAELAYFGAKVVHPKTMLPAHARLDWDPDAESIPIFIRNTFAPEDPGTRISESTRATLERPAIVCGFTTVDKMALISVEGLGMQGVPGVASRLFSALHLAGISIVLIAQASSEQSISYVIDERDADKAEVATREAFTRELEVGTIETVLIRRSCSVVAAVGDAMPYCCGVAGKFFDALGLGGVHVLAVAQGQNQRNISAVVDRQQSQKALQALHAAFLTVVPIAVVVIGAGRIAECFLTNIGRRTEELVEQLGADMRVVAVCDPPDRSEGAWQSHGERLGRVAIAEVGEKLDPLTVLSYLAEHGTEKGEGSVAAVIERLAASPLAHKVVVDCSDSKATAQLYKDWLDKGVHVVSQNYVGFASLNSVECGGASATGPGHFWKAPLSPRGAAQPPGLGRAHVSAAIGRGLPVLPTMTVLRECGDRITRVDGIFCYSLHDLCRKVAPADGSPPMSFAEASRSSLELGLAQDQEDMTSGQDVLLQLQLLGRELAEDFHGNRQLRIEVEPVTEAALMAGTGDEGSVLRYVGELDMEAMTGSLKLSAVPRSHPFAQLPTGQRIVRIFTKERGPIPVVLSGPVGCNLVADALLADCLQLVRGFGAKQSTLMPPSAATQEAKLQSLRAMRRAQSNQKVANFGGSNSASSPSQTT